MNIGGINNSGSVFAVSLSRLASEIQGSNARLAGNTRLAGPTRDWASLSLAATLRGQVSGHQAGVAAAQTANAMSQTITDALIGVRDILTEVRTLADSWNNGTGDKAAIHERMVELNDQLTSQLDVRFGEHSLLAGGAPVSVQIGPNAGDTISLDKPDAVGMVGSSVSSFAAANPGDTINTGAIDSAIAGIDQAGSLAAADQSRLGHAINHGLTQIENLMGAEEVVSGLDIAKETAHRTRLLMLQEVNASALAQTMQHERSMISMLLGSLKG